MRFFWLALLALYPVSASAERLLDLGEIRFNHNSDSSYNGQLSPAPGLGQQDHTCNGRHPAAECSGGSAGAAAHYGGNCIDSEGMYVGICGALCPCSVA